MNQLGLVVADANADGDRPIATDDYPEWYRHAKTRKTSNLRVLRGIHPRGRNLGPEESRCGSCTRLVWASAGNQEFKRCVYPGIGVTRDSDVIMAWRGCELYERAYPVACATVHVFLGGHPWQEEYVERLTADQWLLVFESDVVWNAELPQDAPVEVAIDELLQRKGPFPGFADWQRLRGLVT